MVQAESDRTVVLITGCSSGIGRALALRLVQNSKHIVYATMRKPESFSGRMLREKSRDANGVLCILPLDVSKTDSCAKAVDKVVSDCGRIDVLVNNAGHTLFGASEHEDLATIKDLFNTNVFGTIDMCQRVMPLMRKRRQGRIINISSVGGVFGQAFGEVYCSSKFAVEGFTQSIARYCRNFGVHACTVCPGSVKTALRSNMKMPPMREFPVEYASLYWKALLFYTKKKGLYPQEVGPAVDVIVKAMTDEKPKIRYITNPELNHIFELSCGRNADGEAAQALSDEKMFDNWKDSLVSNL